MKTFTIFALGAALTASQQIGIEIGMMIAEEEAKNAQSVVASDDVETCWVKAYGRGVGKPISSCPADKEKDGLLCYPLCRDGYNGVGPVCW